MSAVIKNRKLKKESIKNSHPKLNQRVRRSALRKVSVRHGRIIRKYTKIAKEFIRLNPLCKIELPGCTRLATQIHHSGKKYSEELWLDTSLFIPCCHNCHRKVEQSPALAKELGIYNYKA